MSVEHHPELHIPHQPGIMLIHLLNRCNLHCRYCYMEAASQNTTRLPVELVMRSMGEAGRLGIGAVWLSGGEPFLYPELEEVLTAAAGQEGAEVSISTNGTLIGKAEADLLKATGVGASVSIDGPEEYHDVARGLKGAFRRASDGIEHLTASGVTVGIVAVICRENLALLPWLARWAAGMGVARLTAQPLLQVGRGSAIKEMKLADEQLCDLALLLSDLAQTYGPQGLRMALAYRPRRFLAEHPCAAYVCNGEHCHRGVEKEIKKLVIREDGTVLPETPVLDPRFALGSVYEATLAELVANYFANGYAQFDRLCRTVYEDVIPTWTAPLIPWTEILTERSWLFEIEHTSAQA
jgi:MoaA/NifB/PqqE/SkfB family radical SAM enzyme